MAPGSDALEKMLAAAGPSLILIDETLSYITKASGFQVGKGYLSDQAQEFLLELTRAVNTTDDVALVLTMTSNEPEQIGEAAIRTAKEIDTAIRILRRTRQVEVSTEREELYEILKRRLFDTDPAITQSQARAAAQSYWDYYRAHSSDFPQEAQSSEYRELMVQSYPFHPALIEVLRDRWGSISGFQRTRGVLRLLALVIADLYRRQVAVPLIQPAHINLDNGQIRAELLEYVDNKGGYESAILSDIGGTDESRAPVLDRITGGDYSRRQIATSLETSHGRPAPPGPAGSPTDQRGKGRSMAALAGRRGSHQCRHSFGLFLPFPLSAHADRAGGFATDHRLGRPARPVRLRVGRWRDLRHHPPARDPSGR